MVAAISHTGRHASRIGEGARVLLALVRIVNGTVGLLAPVVISRQLSEGAERDIREPANYPFRLFGVRTIIIGAELLSRDPNVRERAVRTALLIHGTDTLSAALGGLLGELPEKSSARLTALSAGNTLLALLARRTLQ